MSFEIIKAGWLHRQSSILRRWKKSWVVIYQDGSFKYFSSPDEYTAEEAERMSRCKQIISGAAVDAEPPDNLTKQCLFSVRFADKTWVFCAESLDDMRAWQISLEQFRAIVQQGNAAGPGAPPPYAPNPNAYPQQQAAYAYPGQQFYGSHPPAYVVQQGQPGHVTYVYTDNPRCYRRGYDGTDVAMGMVAGAALGSMMWGPLLWW